MIRFAAVCDWRHKRALQERKLEELRAQVQEGLADIAAGRGRDFDAARIIRYQDRQRLRSLLLAVADSAPAAPAENGCLSAAKMIRR